MGPPKTWHVETCDNLSFSHCLACHISNIHTRFKYPREITGATFYVLILRSRLCFLKSRIVNRCSIIRNKETCETLLPRSISVHARFFKVFNPRVVARCTSKLNHWRLVNYFTPFGKSRDAVTESAEL